MPIALPLSKEALTNLQDKLQARRIVTGKPLQITVALDVDETMITVVKDAGSSVRKGAAFDAQQVNESLLQGLLQLHKFCDDNNIDLNLCILSAMNSGTESNILTARASVPSDLKGISRKEIVKYYEHRGLRVSNIFTANEAVYQANQDEILRKAAEDFQCFNDILNHSEHFQFAFDLLSMHVSLHEECDTILSGMRGCESYYKHIQDAFYEKENILKGDLPKISSGIEWRIAQRTKDLFEDFMTYKIRNKPIKPGELSDPELPKLRNKIKRLYQQKPGISLRLLTLLLVEAQVAQKISEVEASFKEAMRVRQAGAEANSQAHGPLIAATSSSQANISVVSSSSISNAHTRVAITRAKLPTDLLVYEHDKSATTAVGSLGYSAQVNPDEVKFTHMLKGDVLTYLATTHPWYSQSDLFLFVDDNTGCITAGMVAGLELSKSKQAISVKTVDNHRSLLSLNAGETGIHMTAKLEYYNHFLSAIEQYIVEGRRGLLTLPSDGTRQLSRTHLLRNAQFYFFEKLYDETFSGKPSPNLDDACQANNIEELKVSVRAILTRFCQLNSQDQVVNAPLNDLLKYQPESFKNGLVETISFEIIKSVVKGLMRSMGTLLTTDNATLNAMIKLACIKNTLEKYNVQNQDQRQAIAEQAVGNFGAELILLRACDQTRWQEAKDLFNSRFSADLSPQTVALRQFFNGAGVGASSSSSVDVSVETFSTFQDFFQSFDAPVPAGLRPAPVIDSKTYLMEVYEQLLNGHAPDTLAPIEQAKLLTNEAFSRLLSATVQDVVSKQTVASRAEYEILIYNTALHVLNEVTGKDLAHLFKDSETKAILTNEAMPHTTFYARLSGYAEATQTDVTHAPTASSSDLGAESSSMPTIATPPSTSSLRTDTPPISHYSVSSFPTVAAAPDDALEILNPIRPFASS